MKTTFAAAGVMLSFVAGLATLADASPAVAAAPPQPKLIVTISVDQFSADLFAEYRGRFTAGLARLSQGVVFPSAFHGHAATETCPGHASILTGARPARSGIVANTWFDLSLPRADKAVYCAEDPTVPGSSSANYTPSVATLRVPTLGDRMKQAGMPARVVAVAGKDRAALMMAGHRADQSWFMADTGFRTTDGASLPAPAAIGAANARLRTRLARDEAQPVPPACSGVSGAIPVGSGQVGAPVTRRAGDLRGFRASPAFDEEVTDLALGLLDEMKLGRGAGTDLLIVGLSATDYVGHAYGTQGAEMCAQVAAVDRQVGRLMTALDATRVPYVVVFTADHGGTDLPERTQAQAIPTTERAAAALFPSAMDRAMRDAFGIDRRMVWGDGPFGDIYLARDLPPAIRPLALSALRARYLAHPQVEAVFTRDDLLRTASPNGLVEEWSLIERARASFDAERSGDLVVLLKPNVMPLTVIPNGNVATHGSPWNRDRRVPVLFWWRGIAGFEQPYPVEVVDIMPTLAPLVGLRVPADEIDGRCIDLDSGPGNLCAIKK